MSIMPQFALQDDTFEHSIAEQAAVNTGKNPMFDFQSGEFVFTATGRVASVEGLESLKHWAKKALLTARDRFFIYTSNYGNEAHELIGSDLPDEILFMELQRNITEALIYDPRVTACTDFRFERLEDRVMCDFTLITPLGAEAMQYTLEVN